MLLKKLKTTNYMQHQDRELEFVGNLILLVGQNGSGKSNLIGAIQFALTGEQPGFKKEQLLSWGATEGSVELWFVHNGEDAYVLRNLHNNTARFEYQGKRYNGITAVNEALKAMVGIDRDVSRQAVFVRQGELDEVLFTDPRARELSFQRLMGISEAQKIHKTLGEMLAQFEVPVDYDHQIAEGRKQYSGLHDRVIHLTAQRDAMQQSLAGSDSNKIRDIISSKSLRLNDLRKCSELKETRKNTESSKALLEVQLSQVPELSMDIGDVDRQAAELHKLMADAMTWKRVNDDYRLAGEAMIRLGTAPVNPDELRAKQAKLVELNAAYSEVNGRMNLHANLLNAIRTSDAKTSECPVCGSTITDIESLKVRLAGIVERLKAEGLSYGLPYGKLQQEVNSEQALLTGFQDSYNRCLNTYNLADAALARARRVDTELADIQAKIQALTESKQAALHVLTTRTRLTAGIEAHQKELDRLDKSIKALADSGIETWNSAEWFPIAIRDATAEIELLKTTLDTVLKFERDIAGLDGMISEVKTAIGTLDQTIAMLEYKRSTQSGQRVAVETLKRVRDWFHYENGPKTMSTAVLAELNTDVNRFLEKFEAPFYVVPVENGVGFNCSFTDGRMTPAGGMPDASVLSGGQKVRLAVSFRLASYCMFANKLGLLSLDEPTVFLDDEGIARFADMLEQLKKVAKGMNLQIILATHEKSLSQYADTVLDLGRKAA